MRQYCGTRRVITFDPSYIRKSGRKTEGVGWFWPGNANQSKWGLEIGSLAVLDLDNHTALHLEAIQTIQLEKENLLEFYAHIFTERMDELKKISNVVVAMPIFLKNHSYLSFCFVDLMLYHDYEMMYVYAI